MLRRLKTPRVGNTSLQHLGLQYKSYICQGRFVASHAAAAVRCMINCTEISTPVGKWI